MPSYEGIPLVDPNQQNKIDTINAAITALVNRFGAGFVTIAMADGNQTLSENDALTNYFFDCTGTLTAARNLVVPANKKPYVVRNATDGGFAVTVKTASGSGIAVAAGKVQRLYCDGTNVIAEAPAV